VERKSHSAIQIEMSLEKWHVNIQASFSTFSFPVLLSLWSLTLSIPILLCYFSVTQGSYTNNPSPFKILFFQQQNKFSQFLGLPFTPLAPALSFPVFCTPFLCGVFFYSEDRGSRFLWNTGSYNNNICLTANVLSPGGSGYNACTWIWSRDLTNLIREGYMRSMQ